MLVPADSHSHAACAGLRVIRGCTTPLEGKGADHLTPHHQLCPYSLGMSNLPMEGCSRSVSLHLDMRMG